MGLTARLVLLHAHRVTRHAARRRRRRLVEEMAAFGTPREVDDMMATFDRYPDGVTHEYRDVLSDQLARRQFRSGSGRWRAMGQY
jgi:hypothetical protein